MVEGAEARTRERIIKRIEVVGDLVVVPDGEVARPREQPLRGRILAVVAPVRPPVAGSVCLSFKNLPAICGLPEATDLVARRVRVDHVAQADEVVGARPGRL